MNIENVIEKLRKERQIFHSEDDLKFAFAFAIKDLNPNVEVRLERPVETKMISTKVEEYYQRTPIDILIIENKKIIPIELKYKTKDLQIEINNEEYILKNHLAWDIGRYSFRKDIYRIEQFLINNNHSEEGYVFILTNDLKYKKNISNSNNLDKNFSFHENCVLDRKFKEWNIENKNKGNWTKSKEYSFILDLNNEYIINWKEYSKIENSTNNSIVFEYCLFHIEKSIKN